LQHKKIVFELWSFGGFEIGDFKVFCKPHNKTEIYKKMEYKTRFLSFESLEVLRSGGFKVLNWQVLPGKNVPGAAVKYYNRSPCCTRR
jgi:hypothetical protein